MKTFDKESFIIEDFRKVSQCDTLIMGKVKDCEKLFLSLKSPLYKKNWIDSSAKDAPPPDFYNEKTKMMMDVMRLDDSSFVDEKGRVQNPIQRNEGKILREYFGNDYKTERDDLTCFVVTSSGLPGTEDHNFDRYVQNFRRVIEKHNGSIELYKKNHPGFQTVFFLFDESTAYMELSEPRFAPNKKGDIMVGKPHIPCCDKAFLDVIGASPADYFIWYMPWKLIRQADGRILHLPKCAIIQNGKIPQRKMVEYNHEMITSLEQ